jgi:predicted aconitase with swiveling domain
MPTRKQITLYGKPFVAGSAEGEALVIHGTFSLLGSVNLEKGIICESNHEHKGKTIAGKVLVYYSGRGSSGDTFRYWKLHSKGLQPAAIINVKADPIHVQGAIVANIPMVCGVDSEDIFKIRTGDHVRIDGGKITIASK